ncbi:MAG: hypothetical protein KY475_11665 [Planctomycetes bacterium]|nr:hypothetical protein [Planctomycetota bacterium]
MFSWAKPLMLAAAVAACTFAFSATADAGPFRGFGGGYRSFGGHHGGHHGGFHVRPYANYRPHVHLNPSVHRGYHGRFHVRPYAPYRPHVHLNPYVHRPSYRYGW